MRKKPGTKQSHGERVVKDIRRATRKQYSAEEKIRIVLDGLKGEDSIAELCRRDGIAQKRARTCPASHRLQNREHSSAFQLVEFGSSDAEFFPGFFTWGTIFFARYSSRDTAPFSERRCRSASAFRRLLSEAGMTCCRPRRRAISGVTPSPSAIVAPM